VDRPEAISACSERAGERTRWWNVGSSERSGEPSASSRAVLDGSLVWRRRITLGLLRIGYSKVDPQRVHSRRARRFPHSPHRRFTRTLRTPAGRSIASLQSRSPSVDLSRWPLAPARPTARSSPRVRSRQDKRGASADPPCRGSQSGRSRHSAASSVEVRRDGRAASQD